MVGLGSSEQIVAGMLGMVAKEGIFAEVSTPFRGSRLKALIMYANYGLSKIFGLVSCGRRVSR